MAKYRDFDDDYTYEGEDDYSYITRNEHIRRNNSAGSSQRTYSDTGRRTSSSSGKSNKSGKKTSKKSKPRKKMKRWVLILICMLEVLILVGLFGINYILDKFGKINITPIDEEFIMNNEEEMDEETVKTLEGYTNILLLGSDTRDNSVDALNQKLNNHTDAIIICSINNDTKEIRLVSVYRDTVLKMSDPEDASHRELRKATESTFFYGTAATLNMINVNLDLKLTDYVMVNWSALIDIIDAVGGIDLEITEEERIWLNKYLVDTSVNTGKKYKEVPVSGYVHLDGIQATAFCRIRATTGWDYRRTERQRMVLGEVFKKAKSMNIAQLNAAIEAVVGNVSTSLEIKEIMELASYVTQYNLTETAGFPSKLDDQGKVMVNGKPVEVVAPVDLKYNVSELHRFLFGTVDYVPTATVQNISNEISSSLIYEKTE